MAFSEFSVGYTVYRKANRPNFSLESCYLLGIRGLVSVIFGPDPKRCYYTFLVISFLFYFRSSIASRGIFRSPSNVFMFGRGGATNISCTIRFEASSYETVR